MNQEQFVEHYATNRLNTNSLKWDLLDQRYGDPDLIAMWVADMEFKVPRAVTLALANRVAHGIYGYSYTPDSYYQQFFDWQLKRHGIQLEKDWLRFGTGVVNSLYALVNGFTQPGDAILFLTPVYYPFYGAVKDNHRQLVTSELQNSDGHYTIDFADVEQKIRDQHVKMFIQCSPHNPVGRVWTAAEEQQILALCQKYDVLVVSDEIHQDLEIDPHAHPFISALSIQDGAYNDRLIIVNAPSKTFNLAGLINSHVIIPDAHLRQKYDDYMQRYNQTETNILGQTAGEAAYQYGSTWLNHILEIVRSNYYYLTKQLKAAAPDIKIAELQGTYLAWLDIRPYVKPKYTKEFIQDKCHLAVDFGEWFGSQDQGFVRLNLATDPKYVHAAVANIIHSLKVLQENEVADKRVLQ